MIAERRAIRLADLDPTIAIRVAALKVRTDDNQYGDRRSAGLQACLFVWQDRAGL
jgi:hypothetical protein